MEKEDFRTVDDSIRSSYRKKGIALIKKGVKKGVVAQMFGVDKNTVSNWWKNYQENGVSSFKSKKKGVKSEDKKLLSTKQEKEIQLMIIDKMPDQLKLDFTLWTRKAVKELVERVWCCFGYKHNGRLFTQMGFYATETKEKSL